MKTIFITVSVLLVIIFTPLLIIWALNTLFQLNLIYNMENWAATLILSMAISSAISK